MHLLGSRNSTAAGWIASLLAIVLSLPTSVCAEELTVEQQIQVIRVQSEAQRQATMAANVDLTEAEGAKFWPIYREYRDEMAKLGDARVALMKDLADNFSALTDAKAKSLTDGWLANEKQRIELKAKYVGKYQKALSAVKAARVMQIENKLDALVDVGLAASVPLVSPPAP